MERITGYGYSELIGKAFEILPQGIADKLRYVHFLTGVDPIYAGLLIGDNTGDGRSSRNTWCVCYPDEIRLAKHRRQTTIVLPTLNLDYPFELNPYLVVHELGHVLDEILGFEHIIPPVTKYAEVNRYEAFAEAFTLWLCPEYWRWYPVKPEKYCKIAVDRLRQSVMRFDN